MSLEEKISLSIEKRKAKSSPHNHLRTSSYITERTANKAVRMAAKRLGPGGIVGVINFNPSPDEIDPRWSLFVNNLRYDLIHTGNGVYIPELDLLAIRGQEVLTKEDYHILLLCTTKEQNVKNRTPVDEVFNLAEEDKTLLCIDHPFHKSGMGKLVSENPEIYLPRIGFWETHNGIAVDFGKFSEANARALAAFDSFKENYPNICELVSDDGHSIYEIGRSYSVISMPRDYSEFKDSPEKVSTEIRSGYLANRALNLGHKKNMSERGFYDHGLDLVVLISAKKYFGWDPNRKTAPLLQKFGISI